MKTILSLALLLLAVPAHPQVNVKGLVVDAKTGFTVNGSAPTSMLLCGNGTVFVAATSCGTAATTYYQTVYGNGSALAQRSGLNFSSNFTVTDANPRTNVDLAGTISSNTTGRAAVATNADNATNANNSAAVGGVPLSGLCQSSGAGCTGTVITGTNASSGYVKFPTGTIIQWMPGPTFTGAGVATTTGSWPIPFPNAIFGATCSTNTGQGGSGSPGDTDIHVIQLTGQNTSGWSARHSVGGVYAQSQTVSCFLTAIGY